MEMILLDWTRMGKTFCVAGLVADGSEWRTVRPMPIEFHSTTRPGALRNVGWFPSQLGKSQRWDIMHLVGTQSAALEPPHTEDIWVTEMRPAGQSFAQERRSAVLRGTVISGYKPHFGVPLLHTRTSAYLKPGTGERSLVTVTAHGYELFFEASKREGAAAVDVRVRLKLPGVGVKQLPVKDHFLLSSAEQHVGTDPAALAKFLAQEIGQTGKIVAVRLGLSRAFDVGRGERRCWLMADGFFCIEEIGN
jgi:hypothetical protein